MAASHIIYLDNAATTMVAPEVLDAMLPHLKEEYGNPATHLSYALGARAQAAVDKGRGQVAALLNAKHIDEVILTSGGTESDNWALYSSVANAKRKHIVTSAIEHHAVLETAQALAKEVPGVTVTVLPVDAEGRVGLDALRDAVRDDTAIVSIMHSNNEVGTIQPIKEMAEIAHARGALFHTDAVQSFGKVPVDVQALDVDMLSLSGHKIHAPKGVGAMYVKKGTRLRPLIHGGGQERNLRSGTTNVPGMVALGAAAELAGKKMSGVEATRLRGLVERLWSFVEKHIVKARRNSPATGSLPGLLNFCVEGAEGEALLMCLDMNGVCASSGSACTTGSLEPSHVLLAMGVPVEVAHSSLRFSLSHYTTEGDIAAVEACLPTVVARMRAMSPTWKG